jgi:hypothetical protein
MHEIGVDTFSLEDQERWYCASISTDILQDRNSFLTARVRAIGHRTRACIHKHPCTSNNTNLKASFINVIDVS